MCIDDIVGYKTEKEKIQKLIKTINSISELTSCGISIDRKIAIVGCADTISTFIDCIINGINIPYADLRGRTQIPDELALDSYSLILIDESGV